MKDKIIAFINKVKSILANRTAAMSEFHPQIERFSKELTNDVIALEEASTMIQKLDESQPNITASEMYYLLEKVVPVFNHWHARLSSIPETRLAQPGHMKANAENKAMLTSLFELLSEINQAEKPALIPVIDTDKSVQVFVNAYNKTNFLQAHPIQETKQNSVFNSCRIL